MTYQSLTFKQSYILPGKALAIVPTSNKTLVSILTHQMSCKSLQSVKHLWHSRCIEVVFGGEVTELAGRVVANEHQHRRIGTTLLETYMNEVNSKYLATYSRNPSIIKMMRHVCSEVMPTDYCDELASVSGAMSDSTKINNTYYHLDRYPIGGLFQGYDPAERMIDTQQRLIDRFPLLSNQRHALVIAGKVERKLNG